MITTIELFLTFVFAHLLADFPLQTNSIVMWKKEKSSGVIAHSIIVFLVMLALTFPFWEKIWFSLAVVAVLHYFIDSWKIGVEKSNQLNFRQQLNYFFLDQVLHVSILFMVSIATIYYFQERAIFIGPTELVFTTNEVLLASTLVWFVFGQAILNQMLINVILDEFKAPFFTNMERFGGILLRLPLIGIAYYSLWIGIILIAIAMALFKVKGDNTYEYRRKRTGILLNLIFGSLGGIIFHLLSLI